jgi:uncharacterized protein YegJ (DUF2314 family)
MQPTKQLLPALTMMLIYSVVAGCSPKLQGPKPANVEATAKGEDKMIPVGSLMDDRISYQFAIYFLPKPTKEPIVELESLLKDQVSGFRRVEKIDGNGEGLFVAARIENDPANAYRPPDLKSLQYFGRGLSREQAEALQSTETVLVLDFDYSKDHVWDGMRAAVELMATLARNTGGLIWDETTREVFSPEEWTERRIDDWTETVPDITKHIVVHAYKKEEFVRAISLGMAKFGLPDVVIDNFSWSLNRNMGHVINLFAQALAEGAVIQKPGEFDLDFKAIKNGKVKEPQITTLQSHATGIASLALKKGTWEEGDPQNRLIEITFDRGTGPDIHAKQEQVLGAAFGFEDSPVPTKHDEVLEAASRQARTKLPALRAEFNKGLAPGDCIQVKAPFDRPDGGSEFMWVEVTSWQGDKITGLLSNEPFYIPTLHGGQIVEVSEAKVFDYIRRHTDGTSEGNETGKVIERRSK